MTASTTTATPIPATNNTFRLRRVTSGSRWGDHGALAQHFLERDHRDVLQKFRTPPATAPALIDAVLEQVRRVSGVEVATVDGCAPLTVQCADGFLHIVGRPWVEPAEAPGVSRHYVAPGHFETLRVPVLRGRPLTENDRAGRPRAVVINEAAAERFWPDEDPIGKRVWFEAGGAGAAAFGPDSTAEIVGIVGNVAYQPLDEQPNQPGFFTAYAQFTYPTRMVLVRTRGDPTALVPQIARAVRRADPNLAPVRRANHGIARTLSWSKLAFQTGLFVVIGLIALSLAVTGVYAVTSAFVSSHMRDIGVRMALGARTLQVGRTAAARTVRLGVAGATAGLLGTVAVSRIMLATLYETSPLDARVLAGACLVLIAAFAAASTIPVRRALRVNPIDVLRSE